MAFSFKAITKSVAGAIILGIIFFGFLDATVPNVEMGGMIAVLVALFVVWVGYLVVRERPWE